VGIVKPVRIIPRLDIKGPNVVKGVSLEGLRVVGRPELFARIYYEEGADELLYMDAVASLYGRNSLEAIVRRTAEALFIPLTVGGGIRTIDDIRVLLRAGADKVAINTAAIRGPNLINEAVRQFGSQCIVVSIEARSIGADRYECLTDYGRERSGLDAFQWAREAVNRGAGEILLTSVDRDGGGTGFDLELIRPVADAVDVPVIASGGAGRVEHVRAAIETGKADAVCIGSMLHYHLLESMAKAEYPEEGNVDFLKAREHRRSGLQSMSLAALKQELQLPAASRRAATVGLGAAKCHHSEDE